MDAFWLLRSQIMFSFNNFVFPKPKPSYDKNSLNGEVSELIYIDYYRKKEESFVSSMFSTCCQEPALQIKRDVPCLLLRYKNSQKYIIFFHGNAEDLGIATNFISMIYNILDYNIIAVEYPGYGVYDGCEASQKRIEEDSDAVYQYLAQLNAKSEIIIFGRSIGTGPAVFLASKYEPKALVLMSPFESIRSVAKEHVSLLAYILKDKFENVKRAGDIKCPTLIIHGKSDKLISFNQSERLFHRIQNDNKKQLYPENMTHNKFDFLLDIEVPLQQFLDSLESVNVFQQQLNQQDSNLTL